MGSSVGGCGGGEGEGEGICVGGAVGGSEGSRTRRMAVFVRTNTACVSASAAAVATEDVEGLYCIGANATRYGGNIRNGGEASVEVESIL